MGIFTAKSTTDLTTIRQRLAEADATVARLQLDLTASAFECTLSGEYGPADQIAATLAYAQTKANISRRALAAAEAAEHQRLGAARIKANQVCLRAFRAHCGAVKSAALAYEQAVAAEEKAWRSILSAAFSARALLPADRAGYIALFEGELSNACNLERSRIGRRDPNVSHEPSLPGATFGAHDFWQAAPLAERVGAMLATASDTFARSLALPAPPTPPAATPDPAMIPGEGQGADLPGSEGFNAAVQGRVAKDAVPMPSIAAPHFPTLPKHHETIEHAGMTATMTRRN